MPWIGAGQPRGARHHLGHDRYTATALSGGPAVAQALWAKLCAEGHADLDQGSLFKEGYGGADPRGEY